MASSIYTDGKPEDGNKTDLKTVKMFLLSSGKRLRLNQRIVYSNAVALGDKKLPHTKIAEYLGMARQTIGDSLASLRKRGFLDNSGKPKTAPDGFFMRRKPGKDELDIWNNYYQYFPVYIPAPGKLSLDEAAVYSRFLNHEKGEWSNRNLAQNIGIGANRVPAIIQKLEILKLVERGITQNQHYRIVIKKRPADTDCDLFAKVGDERRKVITKKPTQVGAITIDADQYSKYCVKHGVASDIAKRIAAMCVQKNLGEGLRDLVMECREQHDAETFGGDFGRLLYVKLKQWGPQGAALGSLKPKLMSPSFPKLSLQTTSGAKPELKCSRPTVEPAPITSQDRKAYSIPQCRPKIYLEKLAAEKFGVSIHAVSSALINAMKVAQGAGRDTGGEACSILEGALINGQSDIKMAMIDSAMLLPFTGRPFISKRVYP